MSIFAWVGGSTGTTGSYTNPLGNFTGLYGAPNMNWVLPFDWNNALNWYEYRLPYIGANPNFIGWWPSNKAPAIGDIVKFCPDGVTFGVGNSSSTGGVLPQAKAPCLFGGASQSGNVVTWLGGLTSGAGASGTTYDSSLLQIHIGANGLKPKNNIITDPTTGQVTLVPTGFNTQYPFSYIGGGLFTGTGSAGTYPQSIYFPPALLDAAAQGFVLNPMIWGGTGDGGFGGGWSAGASSGYGTIGYWNWLLTPIFGNGFYGGTGGTERLKAGIRIKTPLFSTTPDTSGSLVVGNSYTNSPIQGIIQINCLKNIVSVPGVSGATATAYVNTVANLYGTPEYVLSGYFNTINRFGCTAEIWNNWYNSGSVYNAPNGRKHLTLKGATAGKIDAEAGRYHVEWNFDDYSNVGFLRCAPKSTSWYFRLANEWNRAAVFQDLGMGTTFDTDTQIWVGGWSQNAGYNTSFHNVGLVLGRTPLLTSPPTQVSLKTVSVGEGASTNSHGMYVLGPLAVNKLLLSATTLATDPFFVPYGYNHRMDFGEVQLSNNSSIHMMDYYSNSQWYFGIKYGDLISGGIVFTDEMSTVVFNKGVRLYNDQLEVSNFRSGVSNRLGKINTAAEVIPNDFV